MNKAIIIFLIPFLVYGRTNLKRFSLLKDQNTINKSLSHNFNSFFDLEINISSGLKGLVGEITNISENNSSSSAQQELETFAVLNKLSNTENYLEINAEVGVPLPYFKLGKYDFLPSAFYKIDLGTIFTITNPTGTDLNLGLYLKNDTSYGLKTFIKDKDDIYKKYYFSVYKISRLDLATDKTSSQIVEDKEIFDFSGLSTPQDSLALDLGVYKTKRNMLYTLEVKEIHFKSLNSKESKYGKPIFLHAKVLKKTKLFSPFLGIHYRSHYRPTDGLYLGFELSDFRHMPLKVIGKIDLEFINILTMLKFKYFYFSYSLKTPYQNPKDDVWVPAMHSINLGIPFL